MHKIIIALRKTLLNFLMPLIIGTYVYSCANPGIPTGGPKDDQAPVVTETDPENYSVSFKEKKISIHFNEYVQLKEMNEKFMMSPPQKKKPTIKLKGKYIQIELRDTLKDSTTYTLDFADAIVDNNESNPLGDFQYVFSTGEKIDSMRIEGHVQDAFTLKPVENAFVMVYMDHNDSIPLVEVPSYIARTDTAGHFSINNIQQKSYRIVAITDNNRDYIFNSPVEPVAFMDSLITPEAFYKERIDTIAEDSIMLRGYTLFSPADIHLVMFEEEDPQIYLTKYDRPRREKLEFHFNRSRTDSMKIDLLDIQEGNNWFLIEKNSDNDTLSYWITDSLIYNRDTLMAELQYLKTDTTGQLINFRDTLKLNFRTPKKAKLTKKQAKKKIDIKPVLEYNLGLKSPMDLNGKMAFEFNEPIKEVRADSIHLFMLEDTLEIEQDYKLVQDSLLKRRYYITHSWKPETDYRLQMDSAAFANIYGLPTKSFEKKFKTQETEYYGKIILGISNVNAPLIVQLLKDNDKEPVIQSKNINTDQEVVFSYLYPDSYIIKVIVDLNENGKWDTGNYLEHRQPEIVHYFKSPIKVRSNWDVEESWELP